jgi:hypothetical protein
LLFFNEIRRLWSIRLVSEGFHLLDCSSLAVNSPDLVEKVAKLVFHVIYELSFGLEGFGIVNFGETIVDLLIPSHMHFFLVENGFIAKTHQHLNGDLFSIGVLDESSGTLIMPVFSKFLSTFVASGILWPSG